MDLKAIIYRHHDRHVEDVFEVYPYTPENYEIAKKRCIADWPDSGKECLKDHPLCNFAYGWPDGTIYNDSYFSTLQVVPLRIPGLNAEVKNG